MPVKMLELKIADLDDLEVHHLMHGIIVPRPIAWVSTTSGDGRDNLAPFSYFNAVSDDPPIVMFASSNTSDNDAAGRKDTLRNVEATKEFVVHLVPAELKEAMNASSPTFPPQVDEFLEAGLEKAPSVMVRPPRIARAGVAMECRLVRTLPMGDATVIFGEIVFVHLRADAYPDKRVDVTVLDPITRLNGSLYARLGEVFRMKRPTLEQD